MASLPGANSPASSPDRVLGAVRSPGRRVIAREEYGAYVVLRCPDPAGPGPRPGSSTCSPPARGGAGERPSGRSCPGPSASCARPPRTDELHFLLEDVGPGTKRLCELAAGDALLAPRSARDRDSPPRRDGRARAARRRRGGHRAAGHLAGPARRRHAGRCSASATRPRGRRRAARGRARGHRRRQRRPPRTGHRPARRRARPRRAAEVYACGPPPMLEAVRRLCAEHQVPAQLALESGMACGFGACFGCVVPTRRATCGCASTARCSTRHEARPLGRGAGHGD